MRILKLTIFLVLHTPYLLLAQQGRNLDDHVRIKMSHESLMQDEKFVGSPHLSDEFVNGEIKSLKSWIQSFPDRQNELTEFADKEKISVEREEDMIRLVKYYNSL